MGGQVKLCCFLRPELNLRDQHLFNLPQVSNLREVYRAHPDLPMG